ncbi:uncharacterized protein VP01_3565g2, partial [Puccinia sorghi]
MKKKRTRSQKEAPGGLPLPPEVINLDAKEGSDKDSNPNLAPEKQSWVMIKKDLSGSTKLFHEHLMRMYQLVNPKLGKKINESQASMARYLKTEKLAPKVSSLLAEADLPFSVVKQKSFQSLIHLLNEQAVLLMNQLSRQNILTHLTRLNIQAQEK